MSTNHKKITVLILSIICLGFSPTAISQKKLSKKKIEALKTEVAQIVESNHKQSQIMVDKVFSFSELGFQEIESSKYLTSILKDNGFEIEKAVSGIPTTNSAEFKTLKSLCCAASFSSPNSIPKRMSGLSFP